MKLLGLLGLLGLLAPNSPYSNPYENGNFE